jgi:GT2 family glycosyltransferase
MTARAVSVSVVIPSWNGASLLGPCLDALAAQTHRDVEVIVVDNGSTDGSLALLAARVPAVQVVTFPENRGFCGAVNAGIRKSRGEIVALLNNDTRADPGWLEALVLAFERRPDIDFCASKMVKMHDPHRLDNAGVGYRVDGFALTRGANAPDGPEWNEAREIFGACAGAGAYRRAVFDDVGLLDERFFAWYEEVDLSFRAQLRGHRCLYVPAAVVHHRQGASTVAPVRDFLVARNRVLTWLKVMPGPLMRRWPLAFPRSLVAAAWSDARLGRARAHVRGLLGAARLLPPILADRARIQRGRRVSLAYIASILTPRGHADPPRRV